MTQQTRPTHWTPAWLGTIGALLCVAVVMAQRGGILPVSTWGYPVFAVLLAGAAVVASLIQGAWLYTHVHRVLCCLAPGTWIWWTAIHDFSRGVWTALAGGVLVLVAMTYVRRSLPDPAAQPVAAGFMPGQPSGAAMWEADIRGVTHRPVAVTRVEPWPVPADGERVYVNLPIGMTARELGDYCSALQGARRLLAGCQIRVLPGDHQGSAVLDVMLRDSLADQVQLTDDTDFSPVSICDDFPIMYTPQREPLLIGLRIYSMVVGGAPDAGKTTVLHRILLRLARCADALSWVVDMNGGGIAEPWVRPWAVGEARDPAVDWVANDESEAAALTAVAMAVLKDRKSSEPAVRRKRAANVAELPVDKDMPALVVVTDEGGEVAQAETQFGRAAGARLSRIAQIGRAEGGRIVMCVLRGTGDLLDKALRVCAAIRICLQMEEEDEYGHVLGMQPGRDNRLIHKGTGYLVRKQDIRPVFGRSLNIARDVIERAVIATQDVHPQLDARARLIASRVRPRDVLGRDPTADEMQQPVMRDAAAGKLYENRWVRQARWLAEMRGEVLPPEAEPGPGFPVSPDDGPIVGPPAGAASAPTVSGPIADLLRAYGGDVAEMAPAAPAAEPVRRVDVNDPVAIDQAMRAIIEAHDRGEVAYNPKDQPPLVESAPAPDAPPAAIRPSVRDEMERTPRERWPARLHILEILADHGDPLTSAQIGQELERRGAEVTRTHRHRLLAEMVQGLELDRVDGRYRLTGPA